MSFNIVISYIGSGVAVIAGVCTMLLAAVDPNHETDHSSLAGLVVALAGLATAIGAQIQPLLKIYLDERREQRNAAEARHDTSNKLHVANLEIQILKQNHDEMIKTMDSNRNLILLMLHRHDSPSEAHPDPEKEYQDARETTTKIKDR